MRRMALGVLLGSAVVLAGCSQSDPTALGLASTAEETAVAEEREPVQELEPIQEPEPAQEPTPVENGDSGEEPEQAAGAAEGPGVLETQESAPPEEISEAGEARVVNGCRIQPQARCPRADLMGARLAGAQGNPTAKPPATRVRPPRDGCLVWRPVSGLSRQAAAWLRPCRLPSHSPKAAVAAAAHGQTKA